MIVLGFAGRKGSGKTTAAAGVTFALRKSFAGPLKAALLAMGFERSQLYGELKEVPLGLGDLTPRKLMQTLGDEWGRRVCHPDFWTWLARADVEPLLRRGIPITFDDVRYPNEVAMIRELGGKVAWVHPWQPLKADAHVSENSIGPMDCDRQISCAESADQLRGMAYRIANDMMAEALEKKLG